MNLISKPHYARRISPWDGEYFFGYYDLQPFGGKLHLAHKTSFSDRLQGRHDTVQVGLLGLETEKFEPLDVTGAWNFQQGSMLQWNPAAPEEEVIYNSLGDGDYNATVLNLRTGKKRFLDRPVANVSRDGKYALSINFARLYDFRPGYGYARYADPFFYRNHSDRDGVFLTDMETGRSRLVLSMEEIWEFSHAYFGDRDEKMVINHITFNTDGSRFLMLVRNFPERGKAHATALITADRDGRNMFLLSDYGVQSHYSWRDPEHLIFYAGGRELACSRGWANTYILKDRTWEGEVVAAGAFSEDTHMSWSPDGRLLLMDTDMPDKNRMTPLMLYSPQKDLCVELGRFYCLPPSNIEIRCDLHPRWNRNGDMVSFDSTHEGRRGIYVIDLKETLEEYFS